MTRVRRRSMLNRNELIFIIISFLVIFSFVQSPIILGYLTEPSDMVFTGRTIAIRNFFSYQGWMNQASEGHLIFTNMIFTHEPIPHLFINLYFLLIGALAGISGIGIMSLYFIFYTISAFLFFLIMYKFISMFSEDYKFRKASFLIALTSTGFGVFLWSFIRSTNSVFFSESAPFTQRIFPIDLWLNDAFPILTLHGYSLHVISLFFMLGAFILFIKGWENQDTKTVLCSGIVTLILGAIHPYDIVTVYAVTFVFVVVDLFLNRQNAVKKIKMYTIFILISSPIALFTVYVFIFHPVFNQITSTNLQISPNPFSYIIGGGIPFLLAAFYFFKKIVPDHRKIGKPVLFISVWTVVNYILAYSPIVVQRKLILGMHIPLAILATLAIFEYILPRFRKNRKSLVIAVLIILMLPTGVFYIVKENYKVSLHEEPYYLNKLDMEAIEWIMLNTGRKDVVMADLLIAGHLAGRNHLVLAGHEEAIGYSQRKADLERFFTSNNHKEVAGILEKYNISYVYYGHEEQELSTAEPNSLESLIRVFENERVKIFKVK